MYKTPQIRMLQLEMPEIDKYFLTLSKAAHLIFSETSSCVHVGARCQGRRQEETLLLPFRGCGWLTITAWWCAPPDVAVAVSETGQVLRDTSGLLGNGFRGLRPGSFGQVCDTECRLL